MQQSFRDTSITGEADVPISALTVASTGLTALQLWDKVFFFFFDWKLSLPHYYCHSSHIFSSFLSVCVNQLYATSQGDSKTLTSKSGKRYRISTPASGRGRKKAHLKYVLHWIRKIITHRSILDKTYLHILSHEYNTCLLNIDLKKKKLWKNIYFIVMLGICGDPIQVLFGIFRIWAKSKYLYMAMLFCSMEIMQPHYFLTDVDFIYLHRADWARQEAR